MGFLQDLITAILILLVLVVVYFTIYGLYKLITYLKSEKMHNCMFPTNPNEAINTWKSAGVDDFQINLLLGTYYPPVEKSPDGNFAKQLNIDDKTMKKHYSSKWSLSNKTLI